MVRFDIIWSYQAKGR